MAKFSSTNQPDRRKKSEAVAAANARRKIVADVLLWAINQERIDENGRRVKRATLIAEKLVDMACEGNVYAIREVFDRVDGKPPKAVIYQGDNEAPPVVTVTYNNPNS